MWCMYDNYYVFNHTTDRISGFKPGETQSTTQVSKEITSEMRAWLSVEGTDIDYPIMQGADNVKYLNTDPFGDYSLAGSIFLDSRNSPDFSDDYSLVYGHHMEYGRMFGALDPFLEEKYFMSHTKGTLEIGRTDRDVHTLRVFAVMKASAQDDAVFDPMKNDIRSYLKDHSLYYLEESDERILGLSTCTEGDSAARIVVFCYIED